MATKIVDLEKMWTRIFIVLAATMLSKNQECDIYLLSTITIRLRMSANFAIISINHIYPYPNYIIIIYL